MSPVFLAAKPAAEIVRGDAASELIRVDNLFVVSFETFSKVNILPGDGRVVVPTLWPVDRRVDFATDELEVATAELAVPVMRMETGAL